MKKIKIFFLLIGFFSFAQNRLNDPSIVAQHKRMVFERWGDWRPYPKYTRIGFIKIQTNFAYGTIWGSGNFIAPKRNVRYRKGADIRPLRVGGKEMLRQGAVQLQQNRAESLAKSVDTVYSRNVADFAHWTHLTAKADPLWLLYYKRMLRPLMEFPDDVEKDVRAVKYMKRFNIEDWRDLYNKDPWWEQMQDVLKIMKDELKFVQKTDMPRGKRILLYHRILRKWRVFDERLNIKTSKNKFLPELLRLYKKNHHKESYPYQIGDDVYDIIKTDSILVNDTMKDINQIIENYGK